MTLGEGNRPKVVAGEALKRPAVGDSLRSQTPMREQLEDGRYRKTWKKMVEPDYEFHPELDVQTAG